MSFYVGQKVVCIDASDGRLTSGVPHKLVAGDTYTVSRVVSMTGLHVKEEPHRNPNGFFVGRFRPLDELEQQLERIESEPVEEPEYA